MPSQPAARRTLLASVNAWRDASKALPGFKGDLDAWACATLDVTLWPSDLGLGDLASAAAERWSRAEDELRSALIELMLATSRAAEKRSPEWWAATLLLAVLDRDPAFAGTIRGEMRVQMAEEKLASQAARDARARGLLGGRPSKRDKLRAWLSANRPAVDDLHARKKNRAGLITAVHLRLGRLRRRNLPSRTLVGEELSAIYGPAKRPTRRLK